MILHVSVRKPRHTTGAPIAHGIYVIAPTPNVLFAPGAALWLLTGAFVVLGLYDYGLACRTVAPEWYGRLRLGLSAAVSATLAVAALA